MIIYNYNPDNGIYLGQSEADPNPLDEKDPIIPAHATTIAAPEAPQGEVAVFDVTKNIWSIVSLSVFQPQQETQKQPIRTLDELKALAQQSIDSNFEKLYLLTVPNNAVAAEYAVAYETTKAWVDGGMAGDAPERVMVLAEMYSTPEVPVTPQEAAAIVIQKWNEAQIAQEQRGVARLKAKIAIRNAVNHSEVFSAEAAGREAMQAISFKTQ